jgi:tetratricopeptide (TPR) repeat protein
VGTIAQGRSEPAAEEKHLMTAIRPTNSPTHTPQDKFVPDKSGVGLVVCEPVTTNANDPMAVFGAGCARWLQFNLGGQGALGRSPLWASIDRARCELGRNDLRLTAEDAFRLAAMTGTTHVAVGRITGTPANATLDYQIYRTAGRKPVGVSVQISGPQDRIVTELPQLAGKLASSLGIKGIHLPARVEGTADDLSRIGSAPWLPDAKTAPETRQTLMKLAERMPLAGILALHTSPNRTIVVLGPQADRLLKQAPDNALAFAETGWTVGDILPRYAGPIAVHRKRFPGNYLFALTEVWLQRVTKNAAAERHAAIQVVRDAPDNPDAWLTLGQTANNEADAIRHGRYARLMTRGEWAILNKLYATCLQAEQHSTQLDPLFAKAWLRVAEAAVFAGYPQQASNAFWKSLALDKDNPEVYDWGLQMFQPKWTRDTPSLLKVANLTAEHYHYGKDAIGVVEILRQSNLPADAERMLTEFETHNREALRIDPNNLFARNALAWALIERKDYPGAAAVMRDGGAAGANDPVTHYTTSMVYAAWGRFSKAIPELREAVRLAPDSIEYRIKLGSMLKSKRLLPEAEAEMHTVLQMQPSSGEAWHVLADAYHMDNKLELAIKAYREALSLTPDDYRVWYDMADAYSRQQKFKEAIAAGEKAVQYKPDDVEFHQLLCYAYGMDNQQAQSAREARKVLAVDPGNILAHENLGDALDKLGQRAQARAEWQYVLQHGPTDRNAQEARANLAKYQ